ncbi:hypothetical protein SAMN05660297_00777 [Natronincola peptidivorans]|uniref:Uncharacterized protein n=1 Tax=Natronincola peptidivorans TaxID=426128 RepID=A0A1H9ZY98_9FIRM|nr:hypothetical protein [Natronincola peptidivorans]SES86708.1 hypothetical protein SAMN05660297_00777 [Natronincola peptidivorans]
MELLAWMRKIDGSMGKTSLLQLIDEMHGAIDALLMKTKEQENTIKELREALEQQQ